MPIVDIKNSNSWYQEFNLLISSNKFLISTMYSWYQYLNSWYQQIIIDISNAIADIKNSNFWYQQFGINVNSACHTIVAMTTADKLSLSSSSASVFWLTSLRASSRRMTCMMCITQLTNLFIRIHRIYKFVWLLIEWVCSFTRCYRQWNSPKKRCSFYSPWKMLK